MPTTTQPSQEEVRARILLRQAAGHADAAKGQDLETCLITLRKGIAALEQAEKLILSIPTVAVFRAPSDDYEVSTALREFHDPEV